MLLLHAGPTVHPVILTALWGNLQAVTHNKRRLAELEPAEGTRERWDTENTRVERAQRNGHSWFGDLLVEAVADFDEGVQLLVGVLDHIGMQLYAVIHSQWSWNGFT